MRIKTLILAATLALAAPVAAAPAIPAWEVVEPLRRDMGEADKLEVTTADGYIYVFTPRPVTVRVLSIVGRQISQQKLPAGWSRLKVNAQGIYILKAGDATLRVTI